MEILRKIWDDLKHGENIDLYITVLLALGLVILNLIGVAPSTWLEPLTLAVLGLLAISTLGTRYFLEKQLERLISAPTFSLKDRSEMSTIRDMGQKSTEIVVVGIALVTAVVRNLEFFEQKIKDGCHLRFLLLDPESQALQTWSLVSKHPDVHGDIIQTLKLLSTLVELGEKTKGKCEVRISNVFLPFGIAAFDPTKDTGIMSVEIFAYKRAIGERSHFLLTRVKDSRWFEYYKGQYEQLWNESKIWKPVS